MLGGRQRTRCGPVKREQCTEWGEAQNAPAISARLVWQLQDPRQRLQAPQKFLSLRESAADPSLSTLTPHRAFTM